MLETKPPYTIEEIRRALNHCVFEYVKYVQTTPNNLQAKILNYEFNSKMNLHEDAVQSSFFLRSLGDSGDATASKSAFGSLRKHGDDWVLSFRGTMRAYEWLKNSKFLPKSSPWGDECRVHSGFLEMYMEMREQVLESTRAIRESGQKLLITGHSLGGAIAQLAACDLRDLEPSVIVFGSPMVGNVDFTQCLNSLEVLRVEHHGDLIVALPVSFESLKGINVYRHAGRSLLLSPVAQDKPMVDLIKENVFAHLPSSYRKALDELYRGV